MQPFDSYAFFPTGSRAGSQSRRVVSPAWWTNSDGSSVSASSLDGRPDDESLVRDEILEEMIQQQQPVRLKALNLPSRADGTDHGPPNSANRLRRQPAVISLSQHYLESGKCSALESHEAGAIRPQTIRPTVATQADADRTNNRASRPYLSSAGMNQPGEVKISCGSRRQSAQTAAASNVAGACEDIVHCAGQQNEHKTDYTIGSGTADTCSRSSIASEETASIRRVGNVRSSIGPLQHSETPRLSPQRAEFLDAQSSSVRHETPLLPPRRHLRTPHNHTEDQDKPTRLKSSTARFEDKFLSPVNARHQKQGQGAMRVETAAREAWGGHDDNLVKIVASCHWGDQSSPEKWLLDADNMLSQQAADPARMIRPGHGADGRRPHPERSPRAPGNPVQRPHRGGFVLGRARAVKMSKPGEARLIKLITKKSRPFNIGCLSSEEADLMASAGAAARLSRRSSTWTDDEQPPKRRSPDIDAASETVSWKKDRQPSLIPRPITRAKERTAHPSKQAVGEEASAWDQNERFRQLVRRLETNYPESTSTSGIPANTGFHTGDSSCPSLISDDGREQCDSPGDTARAYAQAQIFEGLQKMLRWETDEGVPTAPNRIPSKTSFALFNISTDDSELSSGAATREDYAGGNTSSCDGRGLWYQEPTAVDSPPIFLDDSLPSRLRERRRGDRTRTARQPSEPTLHAQCAILRWLLCTTDAPGTDGMHDESAIWWQLLKLEDTYQLRYSDEARADILRVLRFLSGAEEQRPEPPQEVQALLREIFPPSVP